MLVLLGMGFWPRRGKKGPEFTGEQQQQRSETAGAVSLGLKIKYLSFHCHCTLHEIPRPTWAHHSLTKT